MFFSYQGWLFCTFLEMFNLYTDLLLWPIIVDGCMSIMDACIELLSVSLRLNFFQDVAVSNCTAITDLNGLSCFYKVYISMVLSLLKNSGVRHHFLILYVFWNPWLSGKYACNSVYQGMCVWRCLFLSVGTCIYPSNFLFSFLHFYELVL